MINFIKYYQGCEAAAVPTFVLGGHGLFLKRLLDGLDLLGAGGEHTLLQTIELVEAAPRAHLAQTHKDTAHGLEGKITHWVNMAAIS